METQKPLVFCTTVLIEKSPQALPLGAACIASAVKSAPETKDSFNVKLCSVSKEDSGYCGAETLAALIKEQSFGQKIFCVCFSVYVWNRAELEETARLLKEYSPETLMIAGGPEVTAHPLDFENFDYTVAGAGERAVPSLISLLQKGSLNKANLPQGVFSRNSPPEETQVLRRALSPELDTLSSPYLDGTLDASVYGGALWELARGCPFKCSYCYESKGENKVKYFPMERIEQELELFNRQKISQVFVLDPTYNANKKRALELLTLIRKKTKGIFFYFEARAEFIDRELARAFTKIPCALQFGLQSADAEVLKNVHRSFDKKLFCRNISYLNETGVIFGFDLIYGLPGDTLRGFRDSLDFALGLYPNNLETFCLSVLPGTALFEQAEQFGLVYEKMPPYNLQNSPSFPAEDIRKAASLSNACNIFYNDGRAVTWFNSVCDILKIKPSTFLGQFAEWLLSNPFQKEKCASHTEVEKVQLAFLKNIFEKKQKSAFFAAAESLVRFYGALSRVEYDGTPQIIKLNYHPDDLADSAALDIKFFTSAAKRFPCRVRCFKKNGCVDWQLLPKN